MSSESITLTVRCRAFAGFGIQSYSVAVYADCVRVYDSIAGYYTRVHSLSAASIRRIRALAVIGGAS